MKPKIITMNIYTLAEQHLNLVSNQRDSLLRKNCFNRKLEANDLTDAGYAALLDACEHFDASKGIPFEHYASRTIRNAMIKHIKSVSPIDYTTLDEAISQYCPCCDWRSENEYLLELLKEAMGTLTPEDRRLVESRFGFENRPLKLRELSASMNISLQAVDKKLKRILDKLRRYIDENQYTYGNCA